MVLRALFFLTSLSTCGITVINFATLKNPTVRNMIFTHRNIYKYNWTSPDGKSQNQIGHIFTDWHWSVFSGQQIAVLTTIWWWRKFGRD
jgi:hypothetical protein